MIKKHSARNNTGRYFWFTVCTVKGKVITTSEMYTTAAMRDKGIKANTAAVLKAAGIGKVNAPGWSVSEVKRDRRFAKKPADVFHIEDKKGKIKKH